MIDQALITGIESSIWQKLLTAGDIEVALEIGNRRLIDDVLFSYSYWLPLAGDRYSTVLAYKPLCIDSLRHLSLEFSFLNSTGRFSKVITV